MMSENIEVKNTTLGFLVESDKVLMAMKKREFGVNWWNGVGGKVEPKETIEQAMLREAEEEIGVSIKGLSKVAVIDFYFVDDDPVWIMRTHTFLCTKWEGQPTESEEMRPEWFKVNDLPIDEMWPSDRHWLPRVLAGEKLTGKVDFGADNNLGDYKFTVVDFVN